MQYFTFCSVSPHCLCCLFACVYCRNGFERPDEPLTICPFVEKHCLPVERAKARTRSHSSGPSLIQHASFRASPSKTIPELKFKQNSLPHQINIGMTHIFQLFGCCNCFLSVHIYSPESTSNTQTHTLRLTPIRGTVLLAPRIELTMYMLLEGRVLCLISLMFLSTR